MGLVGGVCAIEFVRVNVVCDGVGHEVFDGAATAQRLPYGGRRDVVIDGQRHHKHVVLCTHNDKSEHTSALPTL
jgi:hypothetical protein